MMMRLAFSVAAHLNPQVLLFDEIFAVADEWRRERWRTVRVLYLRRMSLPPSAVGDTSLIPPVEMLFDGSSSVEQFIAFGEVAVSNFLIPRAGLQPSDVFLDLGCGNGSVARALSNYLQAPGRYEGLDVSGDSIKWLQEHYAGRPTFRFTHANVFNKMYNPGATITAAEYRLPYADGTFTQALLKSVFTHMHPRDVRHYLRELGRVIRPGGRALITYFLLNEESRAFVAKDMDVVKMRMEWDGDPSCRVADLEVP
jgi:SAM-dependent methyltransferase